MSQGASITAAFTAGEDLAFRKLAARLGGGDAVSSSYPLRDDSGPPLRDIIITLHSAAYGISDVIISFNGSPPRGTFVVPLRLHRVRDTIVFITPAREVKRLKQWGSAQGVRDFETVAAFVDELHRRLYL